MVYLGGTVVAALLAVVSGCFSFVVLPRAWRPVQRRRPEMTLPMIARGAAVGTDPVFHRPRCSEPPRECDALGDDERQRDRVVDSGA
jgi:hypothetical protein